MCSVLHEQPWGIRAVISSPVGEWRDLRGQLLYSTGTFRNSALSTTPGCDALEKSVAVCLVPKDSPAWRSMQLLSTGLGQIRLWPSGSGKGGKGNGRGQD